MDFANPHFENPDRLWLLAAALVAAIALIVYSFRARRRQLASFADETLTARLLSAHSPVRRVFKNALVLFAIVFFGTALARPQWGLQAEKLEQQGEDTIFVLDTSKSMLVADVRPNRLERAKLAMLDYVRRHGRGRVGLVVFAGQAFLQCPLTLDYDAFSDTLRAVDVTAVPVPGSDVGRGLDEAARALEKNPGRKLIVLLTDGEDLAGAGVQKAEELAKQKVTIYTVGVGTNPGGLIQIYNETGALDSLRDQNGQPVVSHLDEKTLKAIAEATRGEYQALGGIGEGMDKVRVAVTTGGVKLAEGLIRTSGIDRFQIPLGVAIVLLVVESLTGTRRKTRAPQSV